ncbi:hypothetical protein FDA09_15395 [Clostridium botulinum]|uniref:hypothetical protein n=1 Tax=Clostridium botulinum TaxID=1491 RepID=UPI00077404E6|nr:hypothetical protein [Clostridium botulinum]NFH81644.1 hypothetical protein [Clostridium botulinum]NFH83578.1 hypothetical protein [Clostridium botulinum]NFI12748.1 hypothetical protein [Clostridium botulinum]NFI15489.1 hypothetical protein [Clostridium botulinum]NFO85686.1 hypothetical protein [Clostridium botulinum]
MSIFNIKKELNVEIGEIKESLVDYSKSIEELTMYYDEQLELIKQERNELSTLELMMLGYAIDFIEWIKEVFKIELTLGEESLSEFDRILEDVHQMYMKNGLREEVLNDLLKKCSGYFGLVILSNYKGNWVDSNLGPVIQINGVNAFVYNCIKRRIQSNEDSDIIAFYYALGEKLDDDFLL